MWGHHKYGGVQTEALTNLSVCRGWNKRAGWGKGRSPASLIPYFVWHMSPGCWEPKLSPEGKERDYFGAGKHKRLSVMCIGKGWRVPGCPGSSISAGCLGFLRYFYEWKVLMTGMWAEIGSANGAADKLLISPSKSAPEDKCLITFLFVCTC